jgi:heptaprenyl diphosphate synthase
MKLAETIRKTDIRRAGNGVRRVTGDANRVTGDANRVTGDANRVAMLGLLFALALVLSIIEGLFPLPVPVPGIRLGLANIVVMYALFYLRKRDALTLVVLKAVFAAATRGTVAGALSLSGGIAALAIMILLLLLLKDKSTYLPVSASGAVFFNIGQIAAASVILETALWIYLPVLIVSGIVTGFATSILLKLTSPVLSRLRLK